MVAGLGPLQRRHGRRGDRLRDVVLLVGGPIPQWRRIGKEYASALATKALVIDVSKTRARRATARTSSNGPMNRGGAGLATQKALPGAHIVRGFNAIGFGQLAELAHRPGEPVGVPIAGDDQTALALASRLIKEIGSSRSSSAASRWANTWCRGHPLGGVHTPEEIPRSSRP